MMDFVAQAGIADLVRELQRINQRLAKLERLALTSRNERDARRRWEGAGDAGDYEAWPAWKQARIDLDLAFVALDAE